MSCRILSVALAWLAGVVGADGAAAAGTPPDIAGFRLGLPAGEAYELLKKYAGPNRRIVAGHQNLPDLGPPPIIHELQMSDGDPATSSEVIEMDLTLPPQPQRVWRIVRRVFFLPGHEVMPAPLVASLREKYGAEVHTLGPASQGVWWLDGAGQNASLPADMKCDGVGPQGWIDEGIQYTLGAGTQRSDLVLPLPPVDSRFAICRTLTRVAALVQRDAHDLVNMFEVQIADLSIDTSAHNATVALLNQRVQEREDQRQNRAAQQPKPPL